MSASPDKLPKGAKAGPIRLGAAQGSLFRGSNVTEALQNFVLVLSTIAVHIFVGIPVSFAMLVKNTTLALFGAQARPREPIAVAVIGASSGLGRALAMQYATPGRKMLLIARDEQRLFEVAEACRAKGAEANWRSIDITDPDSSLEKELADFHEAYGLDLLIDIAGIVYQSEPDAGEYWTQSYKKIFSTNVLGMVRAGVCAADLMRKAGRGGQIAWMGSIDAWQAYPSHLFYAASRAATASMGKNLRYLLRRDNIFVSTIYPGAIESKMTKAMFAADPSAGLPRSMLIDADKFAAAVKRGLKGDQAHIGVPFGEYAGAFIQKTLPSLLDEAFIALQGWSNLLGARLT